MNFAERIFLAIHITALLLIILGLGIETPYGTIPITIAIGRAHV